LEWESNIKWDNHWTSGINFAYVHATNTSDNRPIAQTPPLSGTLSLDYKQAWFRLGGNLLMDAQQSRVDDDMGTGSGLDVQETSGFAILDVYSHININKHTTLKLGVNNLFDRSYSYHVNRANVDPFNSDPIQVNEPGRAFWLNLNMKF